MKIYKILSFIIFFITFSSCSENYFDFDEVDHYRINVTDEELSNLYQEAEKSDQPIILFEILANEYPKNINDTFGDDLLKYGFKKNTLNKSVFKELSRLFSEEFSLFNAQSKCAPTYRDILLFKKNQKTVGIAKICFDCELSYIIGSKKNVKKIGQNGGFKDLEKILE